jgi:hypothetical protein
MEGGGPAWCGILVVSSVLVVSCIQAAMAWWRSSRAGSSARPHEHAVALRPHIELAFERSQVSIDFAGFSGETLHDVIQEPLDKIRIGRLTPESIAIRMLLPDTSAPLLLPCRKDNLADDPAFRQRAGRIMLRHAQVIADSVHELESLSLIKRGSMQIRVRSCVPLFKLYILNNEEAFFGFYPVQEHAVRLEGEDRVMYDLMGKETVLFHQAATEDDVSTGSQYLQQARAWFDSMWTTVSRDFALTIS